MVQFRLGVALVVAALLGGCRPPNVADERAADEEQPDTERAPEPLPDDLDRKIVEYLDQYGRNWPSFRFHGVVLVARGNEVAVERAFGLADLSSEVDNAPDTRFRIGTMSAQLTAAAVMLLVDRGRLKLQATIDAYLPNYPNGDRITVEHLLTHQSGIENFTESISFRDTKHLPASTDALVASFRDLPLAHAPGREVTPSNSNYVLLSAIVEKVTREPFAAFVAREVLTPLEMDATTFGTTEFQQAVGLSFHEDEFLEPVRSVHPAAFGAAGGYLSTARDLLRFNVALAERRLLSDLSTEGTLGLLDSSIGYGWVTHDLHGRRVAGWPGLIDGMNCSVLHAVDDKTVVIVLANTEVVSAGQVAQDVLTMVYGGDAPTAEEHREVPVPLVEQVSASGHYIITRATERMIEAADPELLDSLTEIDVLVTPSHVALAVPGHGRKRMHPLGDGRFFFKDVPHTTARFVQRADGSGRLFLQHPGGPELAFIRKGPALPPQDGLAAAL